MAATVRQESTLPGPLFLALWLALVSGLIEGGFRLFQKLVLGKLILMTPHVIWMAPLADLFWIGIPALFLLAARKVWPRLVTARLVVAVLGAVAFLPLVLLYTSMHKLVALFLAIALGFQASRVITLRAAGFGRVVRLSVVPLLILAVLGGVAITGLRIYRERHVLATAPAPKPGLPNVLLIIWDTVRGQSMSVYGYGRPTTPYLEQFAREGARFDLAMATAPWTLPSHGAMFTGQRPRDLMRSISQPIVDSFPILAEVMTADGYATGGFVANMAYTTREHGLDRGFAHYDDYYVGWGNVVLASRLGNVLSDQGWIRKLIGTWNQPGRKNAALINQQFLDWQAGQKRRPFFAFLNYFDAHRPYISVEPYRSKFVRDTSGRFHPWMQHVAYDDLTEDEIRWANDEYDGTLAYQDEEVRKLMEELERRGVLQNTLVIVSSDHGEQFGDHKRMGHMNSLYRQLLQVPLLMRLPSRVPAGTVVSAPVSLRDLPKTVLDVAGISDTADFPGASLARYWSGHPVDSVALEPVFSEIGTRKGSGPFSLIKDDYHYIAWQGLARPTELYRLADDPFEENNVIALTQLTEVLKTFESWSELYMGKNVLVKRQGPVQDEENLAVPQ